MSKYVEISSVNSYTSVLQETYNRCSIVLMALNRHVGFQIIIALAYFSYHFLDCAFILCYTTLRHPPPDPFFYIQIYKLRHHWADLPPLRAVQCIAAEGRARIPSRPLQKREGPRPDVWLLGNRKSWRGVQLGVSRIASDIFIFICLFHSNSWSRLKKRFTFA